MEVSERNIARHDDYSASNIVKGFEQQVSPIGCNIAQLVKMSDIANTEVLNKEGKKVWQSYS